MSDSLLLDVSVICNDFEIVSVHHAMGFDVVFGSDDRFEIREHVGESASEFPTIRFSHRVLWFSVAKYSIFNCFHVFILLFLGYDINITISDRFISKVRNK